MSKTNHRVNKDREEKLIESSSHKKRRNFNTMADAYVDMFNDGELIEDGWDEEYEMSEKVRRVK